MILNKKFLKIHFFVFYIFFLSVFFNTSFAYDSSYRNINHKIEIYNFEARTPEEYVLLYYFTVDNLCEKVPTRTYFERCPVNKRYLDVYNCHEFACNGKIIDVFECHDSSELVIGENNKPECFMRQTRYIIEPHPGMYPSHNRYTYKCEDDSLFKDSDKEPNCQLIDTFHSKKGEYATGLSYDFAAKNKCYAYEFVVRTSKLNSKKNIEDFILLVGEDFDSPQCLNKQKNLQQQTVNPYITCENIEISPQNVYANKEFNINIKLKNLTLAKIQKIYIDFGDKSIKTFENPKPNNNVYDLSFSHTYKNPQTYNLSIKLKTDVRDNIIPLNCTKTINVKSIDQYDSDCDELIITNNTKDKISFTLKGHDEGSSILNFKIEIDKKIYEPDKIENNIAQFTIDKKNIKKFSIKAIGFVQDSNGNWKTSDKCEIKVNVKNIDLKQIAKVLIFIFLGSTIIIFIYKKQKNK